MLFYFIPFVAGCALLLLLAFLRPRMIYEFPFFMGAVFIAFILPQAYALYTNQWGGAYLETTLLVCSTCLAACCAGYAPKAHPVLIRKLNVPIDPLRFLHGGIALMIVGWYFTYKFGTLSEDETSSMLTGIGTIYLFFGGLIYPGFAICFYCALRQRTLVAWIAATIAAVVPLQAAVFYGRREPTVLFLLSFGLSLFFIKGKAAPRSVILGGVVGAMFLIPAVGTYRQLSKDDPLAALRSLNLQEEFNEYFDDEASSEVKNAVVLIAATKETADYEWGAGYWNRIVFRFVPAQFLGERFKNALMIGGTQRDLSEFIESASGFQIPPGTTVTGLGDSFNQFGYFGCLIFAAIAYLFKNLWTAARQPNGTMAQILYIQVTTSAMRALTHQTLDFLPGFIYSAIFISLVALYAKERPALGSNVRRPTPSGQPVKSPPVRQP